MVPRHSGAEFRGQSDSFCPNITLSMSQKMRECWNQFLGITRRMTLAAGRGEVIRQNYPRSGPKTYTLP